MFNKTRVTLSFFRITFLIETIVSDSNDQENFLHTNAESSRVVRSSVLTSYVLNKFSPLAILLGVLPHINNMT